MYNNKNRSDVVFDANVKRNTRNFSTKLEKSLGSTESRVKVSVQAPLFTDSCSEFISKLHSFSIPPFKFTGPQLL